MADDFTVQVINEFVALTGRMTAAPEDYEQAIEWEAIGMPAQIVLATLEAEIGRNTGKKWLPRMRLSWAKPAVLDEAYLNWRRAIGPQYRSVS